MRRALLATATLVVAGSLHAEVRLSGNRTQPAVKLTAAGRGIWSPVGAIDALTLNPEGDLRGDGAPQSVTVGARVLAAWKSGDATAVRLAMGHGGRWRELPSVGIDGFGGGPMVVGMDAGWALAWSDGTTHRTHLVAVGVEGQTSGEILIDGDLLGLVSEGSVIHLLVSGIAPAELTTFIHIPDPLPEPFLRVGRWTVLGNSGLGPTAAPQLHALDANIEFTSSPDTTILSWWSSDRELSYVELTPDGPVFPVETITAHGNGTSRPASLRREALKLVEDR